MRLLLVAAAFALGLAGAQAQTYPNRPITVVVPFPAGGPTDAIIRNLGERMRVSLGQPLVVEYVTGAGGTVYGCFLVTGTGAVNTQGSTAGTLYSEGNFSTAKTTTAGDTVSVTYSTSATS